METKIENLTHRIDIESGACEHGFSNDPVRPPLYLASWRVPAGHPAGAVVGKSNRSPEAAYFELVHLTRLQGFAS